MNPGTSDTRKERMQDGLQSINQIPATA